MKFKCGLITIRLVIPCIIRYGNGNGYERNTCKKVLEWWFKFD